MVKKGILIGIGALGLVVLLAGLAPLTALADPPAPTPDSGTAGWGHGFHGWYDIQRVATFLGTTPQEITDQLSQGKTLVEVAQEAGKSEAELVEFLVAPHRDMLALQVRYGYLTQEQADSLVTQHQERIKEAVNSTTGSGGYDDDHCPMMAGYGGMMGGYGSMMGYGGGRGLTGVQGYGGMMGWW